VDGGAKHDQDEWKSARAMTRILFFAPLKAPDHPTPSGDRTMGRLLMRALRGAGFEVELASRLRARLSTPSLSAQYAKRDKSFAVADRLIARARALPKAQRPRAFFTYHLYYKAVDWVGPRSPARSVSRTWSPKQATRPSAPRTRGPSTTRARRRRSGQQMRSSASIPMTRYACRW
jgi:hypothetical protein